MSGDNTDFSMNFIPKMDFTALQNGYRTVLETIYAPKHYYARVRTLLRNYRYRKDVPSGIRLIHLQALAKSAILLGVIGKERFQYWKLMFWSVFTRPRSFPLAVTLAIYGYHFRKIVERYASS